MSIKQRVVPLLWAVVVVFIALIVLEWAGFFAVGPNINGHRFVGVNTSYHSGNGFSFVIFDEPYLELVDSGSHDWVACGYLSEAIRQRIESATTERVVDGHYELMLSRSGNNYIAYLRSEGRVTYLKGFPDFGGAEPDSDEATVCTR